MSDCYIEYDDIGVVKIKCMCCLKEILSQRDIVEINSKTAAVQRRNSSYNQRLVNILNNGKPSTTTCICCSECVKETPNIPHLIEQIRLGVRASLKFNGQIDTDIEKFLDEHYNLSEEV